MDLRASFIALVIVACNHAEPASPVATARNLAPPESMQNATIVAEPVKIGLSPLAGAWLESVTLDDGSEAKVAIPIGATSARPIVVGVHGSGDRPEWSCSGWRGVTDGFAFVVCPHGAPFGDAFAWTSIEQVEKRVLSATAAVRAKYGAYVDGGPAIYAGFSQGARLAPYVVRKHADVFPIVALEEGGYEDAGGAFGVAYAAAGGKRALLSCSTFRCDDDFRASEKSLAKTTIDVRVAKLGNFGHSMEPRVTRALHEQWKWLVRDDARWAPWLAA